MADLPQPASAPTVTSGITDAWLQVVRDEVQRLRFGSVVITVHESQVVQVEKIEKHRFDPNRRSA